MNRRGAVLLQVLVTAVIAGLICASIMRARLQPAMTVANSVQRVENDAAEQGALNRVEQAWMAAGSSCASDNAAGVTCRGAGCSCTCSVAGLGTVSAAPSGGACALTVTSP
jgi:hypothetical protein